MRKNKISKINIIRAILIILLLATFIILPLFIINLTYLHVKNVLSRLFSITSINSLLVLSSKLLSLLIPALFTKQSILPISFFILLNKSLFFFFCII